MSEIKGCVLWLGAVGVERGMVCFLNVKLSSNGVVSASFLYRCLPVQQRHSWEVSKVWLTTNSVDTPRLKARLDAGFRNAISYNIQKQEMLQYVTNAPEGPL